MATFNHPNMYKTSASKVGSFYSEGVNLHASLPSAVYLAQSGSGLHFSTATAVRRWDLPSVFINFDADGDGKLDIYEIARAFRAMGFSKRDGADMEIDKAMFKSFDVNGDGFVSMDELDAHMPPKARRLIEEKLDGGWQFNKALWDASVARHDKYDMKRLFALFDGDGDGKLDLYEIARAFRALGLPKRGGRQMEMDHAMFKSFDVNGDGYVSMEELDNGLKPKTRRKIVEKLEAGWQFDQAAWEASVARHKKYDMADVFKSFDVDGDGKLTLREFMRAFRALGLPKRGGGKMEMDEAMFKSFDTNGDGFVDLKEFQDNLLPKTRKKIEMKLEAGWKFDKDAWDASVARHS